MILGGLNGQGLNMAAMPALPSLTRRQLWTLITLTLVWGCNWPIMKMGVTGYPPLTFRSLSMWTGLPLLGLALFFLKVPFRIPRMYWRELFVLSLFMAIASVLWPERQVVEA